MTESATPDIHIGELRRYFSARDDVAFALLFGSAAAGRLTNESDVDVAVYLTTPGRSTRVLDIEETAAPFSAEHEIWAAVENIVGRNVDLVVLNRAPATVAAAALLTGLVLAARDRSALLRFSLAVTALAEEFRNFTEDFVRTKARSQSLSSVDRGRLLRVMDFLKAELADVSIYGTVDAKRYETDSHFRRGAERWVENLVNASIDAAKIVLASENRPAPQTYRSTMEALGAIGPFAAIAGRLASNTRVRNTLAHEYLDLRYREVAAVAADAPLIYGGLLAALERWIG